MTKYPARGIWSNEFSEEWEEGYIIGNGELGGVLYGKPLDFDLIINHHSCYLKGNPMDTIPDLSDKTSELREVIKSKGYQSGIDYFEKEALKKGYPGLTMSDVYHPAAQIDFQLVGVEKDTISDYTRQLDYEKGLIQESYSLGETQWIKKESFISRDQNCLYFRIESNDTFDINFRLIDFENENLDQKIIAHTDASFLQRSTYKDASYYDVPVKWDAPKAEVSVLDEWVTIKAVRELSIVLSINEDLDRLNPGNYDSIKTEHIKNHSSRYNQVSLELATANERTLDYESLIEKMKKDEAVPLVLYEKLYDASRYIIQSMSGKALPNLQGIWSGDFHPAWSGDFTFDTNVQLAIASYASLGWFEGYQGFFSQIENYLEDFKENARKYYGCRGYLVPVHASTRALHVHWNSEWPLIFWTAGAGWLAHFYHEYYHYTLDKDFLREKAVPFYIETLLFYEDFYLIENDKVVLRPSYSAENGMGDTSTMDIAVVKETIKNLSDALTVLGEEIPDKYMFLLKQLPDYLIDSEGVLKEWIDVQTVENHNHRHFSNLYPVFQTKEITKENSELWQAAQTAFNKRLHAWLLSEDGDTSSSHGRIHAAMCAIALERPLYVESALNELIINRSFNPSLATSHYNHGDVFNVDANGSFPKVIHDSLIYNEGNGDVTLFKALPSWLYKGTLKGIRLPHGVTVQRMEWDVSKNYCHLDVVADHPTDIKIRIHDRYLCKNKKKVESVSVALKKEEPESLHLSMG